MSGDTSTADIVIVPRFFFYNHHTWGLCGKLNKYIFMKKAAKILCIIAMIIGLIWAVVGFFGTWIGGAVVGAVQETVENSQGANETLEKSVGIMLRHLGSFVVVIIAGILGIVSAGKESSKFKLVIFGILTYTFGYLLFPLSNYVAAVLYLVAGLLLLWAGLRIKSDEKNLLWAMVSIGVILVITIGGNYIFYDNTGKLLKPMVENQIEEIKSSEITIDDQIKEIQEHVKRINSINDWTTIDEIRFTDDAGAECFSKDGQLEKIITGYYSEESSGFMEYYLSDGNLLFVLKSDNINDSVEGKTKEEHYYFDKGKLFYIESSKKSSFSEDDLAELQREIEAGFEEIKSMLTNQ